MVDGNLFNSDEPESDIYIFLGGQVNLSPFQKATLVKNL